MFLTDENTLGECQTRCTRGAYTGVVAWTVSANLEATCGWRLCFSPTLHLTLQKELEQCSHHAKSRLVRNNLSSFSLLLHWLHVSSHKGPLTPCHNSFPSNFHQGTRASKVDHFLEKLFKYLVWSAHGARVVCELPLHVAILFLSSLGTLMLQGYAAMSLLSTLVELFSCMGKMGWFPGEFV